MTGSAGATSATGALSWLNSVAAAEVTAAVQGDCCGPDRAEPEVSKGTGTDKLVSRGLRSAQHTGQ